MKKISKWPRRAFNLLMVLAMVISLCAVIASPVAAQECPRAQVYPDCHLSVFVNTYTKNADDSFTPDYNFLPPAGLREGDCFYVNAVVVNDGNATAAGCITATISLPAGVILCPDAGETLTKVWPGSQGETDLLKGRMADFWWKVCCTAPGISQRIDVTVTSGSGACQTASGCTYVNQLEEGDVRCLEVKIVEAPGLGPVTGRLIDSDTQLPVVYESGMPDTLKTCQNFGIKAEITNLCGEPKNIGKAHIQWDGLASLVGGDPPDWVVGLLNDGETEVVGWTLHCDGPGSVLVNVTIPDVSQNIVTYIPDLYMPPDWQYNDGAEVIVYQETPGELKVEITQPAGGYDCDYDPLVIKQATDQIPTCGASKFNVKAEVWFTGAGTLSDVYADLTVSPGTGWVSLGTGDPSYIRRSLGTLTGGAAHTQVDFGNVTCIGEGLGNLSVRAYSMQSGAPPDATDIQPVSQQKVIAKKDPTHMTQAYQNICDPNGFDVSFRYYNWSGVEWPFQGSLGNVSSCVNWGNGNVSLESVEWRKINSPLQVPPQDPDTWEALTFGGNATEGWACVIIPDVICRCCAFDVRWHFKCTGNDGEYGHKVVFHGNVTVQEPAFSGSDTSEAICVNQWWKADLWTDILFFYQNEDGKMIEQDGMVPGKDFHVVIPVVNTGEVPATNVQVYFTITDNPAPGCPKSYTYKGASGDATVSFNPVTGVGVATFPIVYGVNPGCDNAQKVILLLHCNCEGSVRVEIPLDMPPGIPGWTAGDPGMKGIDADTHEGVPVDDIHVPPCPMYFYQIPFTVEIENPFECQTFTMGDIFAVKALIHNGSSQKLANVTATLNWTGNATIVTPQGGAGDDTGSNRYWTKSVGVGGQPGNISAGLDTEITWMLQCSGSGEVYLTVRADSETPWLSTTSEEVNVHQVVPPGACLSVTILSPGENTWIATGQEFAVTAKVYNSGPNVAEGVEVTISDCNYPPYFDLHYVTLVDGQEDTVNLGTIGNGTFKVVTWTLWGGGDHDYAMVNCTPVNDTICVNATMDTQWVCGDDRDGAKSAYDSVEVTVYPAAFLVATIDSITPSTGIVLGSEFTVNYTVTNYGVADAWSTTVTLSANPASSVRIAAGEGGYTQFKSTIPGWSWGEYLGFRSIQGSFELQCSAEGLSTLTITPAGFDECGWEVGSMNEYYTGFAPASRPGREIQSKFIVPVSETIMQSLTGVCPDVNCMNITLKQGWNLMSLPLIPTGGSVTPAALFGGNISRVNAIWGYNGSFFAPTTLTDGMGYWVNITAGTPITVTENGTVNPTGATLPPSYPVVVGWNLKGFKSTCARTAGSYLSGVTWVRIWSYDNGAWSAVNSSDKMEPGLGYWIAATGAGTIFP